MAVKVGELYYEVTLDTQKLINGNRQVDKELRQTSGSIEKLATSLTAVVSAIKLYAAAAALVKGANLADEMRMLAVRVQVAAGGIEQGADALRSLQAISTKTQTALASNVDVFSRLNQAILQMGGTQRDTLALTQTLAQAIKVSGASAEEAKNAMLQFGQALGSGRLQGDELRSLMENAPYLMRQLADALGVPIGALKKLGEEGKLTSDVVTNALSKAAAKIDADFKQFPQTLGGAFTVAADAAARANEKLDELTGTSTALTGIAKGVGEAFDFLATLFGQSTNEADKLGRNKSIQTWADGTVRVLSYVLDAADFVTRVFRELGTMIGGVAASAANAAQGKFAAAAQTLKDTFKDVMAFSDPTYAGVRLRQQQDALKMTPEADRMDRAASGSGGPRSKLKSPVDDDAGRKLKARAEAAQAYYEGLVAENKFALEKIDAEERKALADNSRRMAEDKNNAGVYLKARQEIVAKFARERALLEEKTTQEVADLNIAITTDEEQKIGLIRDEAFRRAEAEEKLGVKTHDEAERAKTLAAFQAAQARAAINERLDQTIAENRIAATTDEITRIDLIRQESFRRIDAQARAGVITHQQAEAEKARATIEAQNAVRQQVLSVNPLAALQQEYEQKLAIVRFYEEQMAKAGVDGEAFVQAKRTELAYQFQQQRQALAEAEFASQGLANQTLIQGLDALESSATSSITGLITGTMTATEAMRGLANTVLNEAVGALVQVGVQTIKNALIGQAAEKAQMATKAANAALYTTAVTAQVGATTALAAQNAFMATAAIPIIGPALAPAAAAAAAAAAGALGAPAIAAAPVAGARMYGGGVEAGSLYRVGENGPEMYTAANGNQYMLPGQRGQVTPNDELAGGKINLQVVVNNSHPTAQVTAQVDDTGRVVQIAVAEVAGQIASNSGPVWSAMRSSTNVAGRL